MPAQLPGALASRPVMMLRPAREQEALRQRRRAALAGGAAVLALLALAREGSRGAAGAGEETGLGFVAPPVPPPGALRGASAAASAAAAPPAASAASSAAGAGAAVLVLAAAASSLLGSRHRQQQPRVVSLRAKKLEELNVGDEFEGTVSRVAKIGIWMDIGAEKEALWPKAQLPTGKEFEVGEKVPGLKIMEVTTGDTPSERKIRVTTRMAISELEVGSTIEGTVARSTSFGVFFDIGASTDVLAPNRNLAKAAGDYQPGNKVTLKIVNIEGEKVTVSTDMDGGASSGGAPAQTAKKGGKKLSVGDKVTGTVTSVNSGFGLFLDIGDTRDALLRTTQLEKPLSEYSNGDTITGLRVSSVDEERGRVEVSPRRLASEVKEGDKLEGIVQTVGSFGIFFDAGLASDVLAPTRLLSKDKESYSKGEVADLTVLKVDGARVTVTTKSEEEVGTPLSKLLRGSTVTGTVVRKDDQNGLFINIGASKDALFRARSLPKLPSEYEVGDTLEGLIIIKVDPQMELLEVGLPETLAAAAQAASETETTSLGEFTAGMEVTGTVTRTMPFGVFLDIGASRDALWPSNQLPKPFSDFKEGEKVEGLKITEVDPVKMRLSVSNRPVPADFKVGDPISEARVTKVMSFGLFVDIGASCDALAPQSLLEKPLGEYKQGETLTGFTVSSCDPSKNQIAVGQKEPGAPDPGARITIDDLKVGESIKGIVRMTKDYGVFMDIGLGRRDALLPASLLSAGKQPESFQTNTELEVYVAAVDKEANRITLSMEPPPEGGLTSRKTISPDWVPPGDMVPDPKYYESLHGEGSVEEDPVDWKAWAEKYPGLITWAEQETEIYKAPTAFGFHGIYETIHAQIQYLPVPVHLRKADAGLPEIPELSFDDVKLGYQHHGIKPEIHTKYRQPPMNDPDHNECDKVFVKKEQTADAKE